MIAGRRRRDRFAAVADGTLPVDESPDLVALDDLRQALGNLPPPDYPTGAFDRDLRAALLAAVERDGIGNEPVLPAAVPAVPRALCRTRRLVAAVVAAFTTGVLLTGVSVAAQSSRPGDPLYSVKRIVTEPARLTWAHGDRRRGAAILEQATERLQDAKSVNQADAVVALLNDMDSATRQGARLLAAVSLRDGDLATLSVLRDWQAEQTQQLRVLVGRMPTGALSRAVESLELLDRLGSRLVLLDTAIDCRATREREDDLGPVPGPCGVPSRAPEPAATTPHPGTPGSRGEDPAPTGIPNRPSRPWNTSTPPAPPVDSPAVTPSTAAPSSPAAGPAPSPSSADSPTPGLDELLPDLPIIGDIL